LGHGALGSDRTAAALNGSVATTVVTSVYIAAMVKVKLCRLLVGVVGCVHMVGNFAGDALALPSNGCGRSPHFAKGRATNYSVRVPDATPHRLSFFTSRMVKSMHAYGLAAPAKLCNFDFKIAWKLSFLTHVLGHWYVAMVMLASV
jgi:hypothetical protein